MEIFHNLTKYLKSETACQETSSSTCSGPDKRHMFVFISHLKLEPWMSFFCLLVADYVKGFGGKFGVQTDRQDKSALGWDHQEKLQLHESQKGTGAVCSFRFNGTGTSTNWTSAHVWFTLMSLKSNLSLYSGVSALSSARLTFVPPRRQRSSLWCGFTVASVRFLDASTSSIYIQKNKKERKWNHSSDLYLHVRLVAAAAV